jgi:hypothetical protein
VARARLNRTLKINTAPRNKPGERFRVHKVKVTRPVVVKLSVDQCPWLSKPKTPRLVVKLKPRVSKLPRHRVVKLRRL